MLVGPRMARTGASERRAMSMNVAALRAPRKVPSRAILRAVLTSIRDTGARVDVTKPCASASAAAALARCARLPRPGWKSAGVLALLCSGGRLGVACRAQPSFRLDEQRQWQALGHRAAVEWRRDRNARWRRPRPSEPIEFAPKRAVVAAGRSRSRRPKPCRCRGGPLRIRGPRRRRALLVAARRRRERRRSPPQYLAALATEIDVGDVGPDDGFDMVLGSDRELALRRPRPRRASAVCSSCRWTANGRSEWIDAANAERPAAPVQSACMMPVDGHITSYFGYRYHPILHFTRFHAGLDIGASWGSPIVAAARRPGGRAPAGPAAMAARSRSRMAAGSMSLYGHMSEIVAQPGSFVRAGQLIGYVGSSGLSTGPHLHFEVRRGGQPVNPLGVRFASAPVVDTHLADAVKARLKALLSIRTERD